MDYNSIFILAIIIFITIIIIAIIYDGNSFSLFAGLISCAGIIMLGTYGSLEEFIPADNDVGNSDAPRLDNDDLEFSPYNNISLTRDIDSLQQPQRGLQFPDKTIDNSALVEQVIQRGNTIFQPSDGIGLTTAMSGELGKFSLAGPSGIPLMDDATTYDLPQNGSMDMDEKLSREQQHRSNLAKRSIDGHVRSTKNIYQKYFRNELDENQRKVWYSEEARNDELTFWP